jgi:transposase-like protein
MTDYGLSTKQIAVIDALSSGVSFTAAAEQVGVHRNTIAGWRRNHLPFQLAFAHSQYDRALLYREKTEELADLAVAALRKILSDPAASPSVLLRAALAVLTTVSTPPEPKKQVQLDIEKIVTHKAVSQHVNEEALEPETDDAAPEKMHNSAQSPVTTIRREGPKIGRNDPCPCGSGLKFKRCCLPKQESQLFAQAA